MFDPLANFKLNKIKKGVDSVKAAVDALPTSLSSSFTDVKNAISGVSTKVDDLGLGVGNIEDSTKGLFTFGKSGRFRVSATKTGQIVSVSGKGRLLFAVVETYNTTSNTLSIEIDGVSYTTQATGVSSTGHRLYFGYLTAAYIPFLEAVSGYEFHPNENSLNIFGGGSGAFLFSHDPVVFNESFVLTRKNPNAYEGKIFYAYELED